MSIHFTVAIPTYNGETRLPKVLDKLLLQIGLDNIQWEIIIVDNNSTDGTARLVQEYQDRWSHSITIRYFLECRQGTAFAREKAIKEAKGKYVGFLDDDNLPSPIWVMEAYKFGEEHPQAGAYASQIHGLFEIEPPENIKPILFYLAITERGTQPLLYEPSKKGFPPGAGLVVRRHVWESFVPKRLFLVGRVGKSMLSGEDSEALLHIHKGGWEIWYNPGMEIEHIIPSWRLSENYLISLMRGVGLSRYHLRMITFNNWERPFAFCIYMANDIRRLMLYFFVTQHVIKNHVVVAAEKQILIATCISPFYLFVLGINNFFHSIFSYIVTAFINFRSWRVQKSSEQLKVENIN
jgi:glycosyltransferase involved in cell wall biosynthesis